MSRKGREKGEFQSDAYICRLYNSPDQITEKSALDGWLRAADPRPSVAFRKVLLDLIRYRLNIQAPADSPAPAPADLDALKADMLAELKGWLTGMIQDDSRYASLTEARRQHVESDEPITADIFDNLLSDFMGESDG